MQTITAKVQVNADHTVTMQLPTEIEVGEYEVVLVLSDTHRSDRQTIEPTFLQNDQSDQLATWESWIQEVEQLNPKPNQTNSDYSQHLIEKYRQQGLEL